MPKQSIGAMAAAQQFLISAFGVSATILGARMFGAEISTWLWVIIVIFFGFVGIFIHKIADWLTNLSRIKKLRHLMGAVLLFIFITWLGWPWFRVQNTFDHIRSKPSVISENERWMSEQVAEQFIIDQLRDKGDKDILVWRVRRLLKWESNEHTIGQFKCESDSTWRGLREGELELAGFPESFKYDGRVPLSEFLGCEVKYSTEIILRSDWVEIDSVARIVSPYPDLE